MARAAALLLLGACRGDAPAAGTFTVRDSAGVRIVENTAPAWAPEDAWTLDPMSRVEIGTVDGEDAYRFEDPARGLLLRDGAVVVGERAASEVRWFAAEGSHLATAGGRGEGPGEFSFLADLFRLGGDTVAAADWTLRRITRFDGDGAVVAIDDTRHAGYYGRLHDGTWIRGVSLRPEQEPATGAFRMRLAVLADPPDGALSDTLAVVEDQAMVRVASDQGRMMMFPQPMGPTGSVTAGGQAAFIVDGAHREVRRTAPGSAAPDMRVRIQVPATPVTAADVAAFKRAQMDRVPEEGRPRLERQHAQLTFPDSLPAYTDVKVEPGGHVWARRGDTAEDGPGAWDVLDPEGRWLGTVETPAGLAVLDVAFGRILGVWRDELDIPFLRIYRIQHHPEQR